MNGPETARDVAHAETVVAGRIDHDPSNGRADAQRELDWHRAETERLQVLVEFLSRPIHAPGGTEPDPDVLSAYNLAVEAALTGIRRAATGWAARTAS